MKTKKSISLILALVMVLALSCGAWAATTTETEITVDTSSTYGNNMRTDGDRLIVSPDGVHVTGATTSDSVGVRIAAVASVDVYGGVTVSAGGSTNRGLNVTAGAEATITGDVVVSAGNLNLGVNTYSGGNTTINGNVIVSGGTENKGLTSMHDSFVVLKGDIVVSDGTDNIGAQCNNSTLAVEGDVDVVGGDDSIGIKAYGTDAVSTTPSTVTLLGDLNISGGTDVYGVVITDGATVAMENGNITMTDDSQTGFLLSDDANLILNGVSADAEGLALFVSDSSGNIDAVDSTLKGDIIQDGTETGAVNVTLTDSTWNGAAEAIDDIGTINITLEGSDWNITGDTNTNGKVTADADSNIDFRGTDENITVIIDTLAGDPELNIKIGDTFTIKNGNSIADLTSSDPSVIEVVKNADGSISIISKGDGDATLTYKYFDGNEIKTGTIGVVSGAGGEPGGRSGGGSSNCNSGVGAALFALLGLAFVYKKK